MRPDDVAQVPASLPGFTPPCGKSPSQASSDDILSRYLLSIPYPLTSSTEKGKIETEIVGKGKKKSISQPSPVLFLLMGASQVQIYPTHVPVRARQ